MLVLGVKVRETSVFVLQGGKAIAEVVVSGVDKNQVRIGFQAPMSIEFRRSEFVTNEQAQAYRSQL